MNERTLLHHTCLKTLLFEIGQTARSCEQEASSLEECVLAWLNDGIDSATLIEKLQNFDYLQQVLDDVSAALLYISQNLPHQADGNRCYFEASGLLGQVKLGETRERILRATSIYEDTTIEQLPELRHTSEVHFFIED